MRATVALPSLVFTVLLGGLSGCAEKSVGPVRILPADPLPALIVSEPLRMPANGSLRANASGAFATASPSLVYLSLPPGSATDGVEATIRNQASNAIAKAAFVNGGFDPVALGAKVGDTLVVDVVTRNPNQPIRAMRVAGADRPPVVVRTNPPAAQPDVPLNSIVLVVFSVPVDSASLSGGSVQLWRDTVRVAGRVESLSWSPSMLPRVRRDPKPSVYGLSEAPGARRRIRVASLAGCLQSVGPATGAQNARHTARGNDRRLARSRHFVGAVCRSG